MIQGYGDSLTLTTSYAIVPIVWQDDKINKIAVIESTFGFGMVIGAPIGSFLYSQFGYKMTYFIWAVFVLIIALICFTLLPDSLNQNKEENVQTRE